jgi:hypothetical protein
MHLVCSTLKLVEIWVRLDTCMVGHNALYSNFQLFCLLNHGSNNSESRSSLFIESILFRQVSWWSRQDLGFGSRFWILGCPPHTLI